MEDVEKNIGSADMVYDCNNRPRWYLAILFGIQHFITMCAPNALTTLILINLLCLEKDSPIKSELISISFFIMGITTLMQTLIGTRLPIIQGSTFAILLPTIALMKNPEINTCNLSNNTFARDQFVNETMPESVFHLKMRLISGAMMMSSLVEILLGCTGLLKILIRLISPLSLASIYTVLSLSIINDLINMMAIHWGISLTGTVSMIIIVAVLAPVGVPIPTWSKKQGIKLYRVKIFEKSPILLSICLVWGLCAILTVSGFLTNSPGKYGYFARTDAKLQAISKSQIFKIPRPFRWGMPIVLPSAIIGMSAGILISIIESIGDYILTAEVCNAPKIPGYAVCRGIFVEGIGVFLSGLLGSAVGPTSYSDNIGVLKITRAGNTIITQIAAIIMILCGIFPVIGALFVSIPDPAVGGVAIVICMMIMGVGITNLQVVNLRSLRNALIYSLSVGFGLFLPPWCQRNSEKISLGYNPVDDTIRILLSISLFITTIISVFLDNVLPGNYAFPSTVEIQNLPNGTVLKEEQETLVVYDSGMLRWICEKMRFLQYFPLFPRYQERKNAASVIWNDHRKRCDTVL